MNTLSVNALKIENIKYSISNLLFFGFGLFLTLSTGLTSVVAGLILIYFLLNYRHYINNSLNNKVINNKAISKYLLLAISLLLFFALYKTVFSYVDLKTSLKAYYKIFRIILIPVFLLLFAENQTRKYALTGFLSGMLISLLIVFNKKWQFFDLHIPSRFAGDLSVAFKDRIFTSLFIAISIFIYLQLLFCYKINNFYKNDNKNNIENNGKNNKYDRNAYKSYVNFFSSNKFLKIGYLAIILISTYYLFYINTGRAGQLIFLALLGLFFIQKFNKKGILIGSIFITLLVTSIISFNDNVFVSRGKIAILEAKSFYLAESKNIEVKVDGVGPYNSSVGERLLWFKNTLKLVKEKPILGWGVGSFPEVYKKHYTNNFTDNPHNQYILTTMELGLVGLMLLLVFFVVLLKESFKLTAFYRNLSQAVILAFILGFFANSWFLDFTSMYFFVFFIGLCLASKNKISEKSNV